MSDRLHDQITRLEGRWPDATEFFEALNAALDLAEEEAVYFGRSILDSGDLLIGLAASGATHITRALGALGVDVQAVRAAVDGTREG